MVFKYYCKDVFFMFWIVNMWRKRLNREKRGKNFIFEYLYVEDYRYNLKLYKGFEIIDWFICIFLELSNVYYFKGGF